jgi:hypothetical protein
MTGSYKSTPAQWSYFRKLTGHSLPSGCSKSKASRLIEQALAGKWKPPVRVIEVGRWRLTDCFGSKSEPKWLVWVDHRTVGPHFDTCAQATEWAATQVREGETVAVKDSIYEQCAD